MQSCILIKHIAFLRWHFQHVPLLLHFNSMDSVESTTVMVAGNANGEKDQQSSHATEYITKESVPTPYEYPNGISLVATLFSLALGTFLMALDTTIITVAVPEIATQFNALEQVGWFGSAYLITLTAFQPIAGSLYKSFDPKTVYLVFMCIFEGKLYRKTVQGCADLGQSDQLCAQLPHSQKSSSWAELCPA